MRRVGMLLCGCGAYDGSDVQEAILLLFALKRRSFRPLFLAPPIEQRDVVDHSTGEAIEGSGPRRVLQEAARLTRGVIQALNEVSPAEIDALVIPGGMGVVKNLCLPGTGPLGGGPLRPEVTELLDALKERRAPVAAIGLAQVVLARHQDRPLDAGVVATGVTDVVIDEERRTLFTPGFMASDSVTEVAEGIERLVDELARWLGMPSGLHLAKEKAKP